MKEKVSSIVVQYLEGFTKEEVLKLMEVPPIQDLGDFALPCFQMAKRFRKSPDMIANEWKMQIEQKETSQVIHEMKVLHGYLNFYLNRNYHIKMIITNSLKDSYGRSKIGDGETICIDYSSPNIAKNFHVGHLRTTLIGNSLAKIYEKLGYHVVRINYLGDWGTQFGKLIVAFKNWSSKEKVEQKGIEELLRIYILFTNEEEKNPDLLNEARIWFAKMESGDKEALSIWRWFKEISLVEYERIYKLLGVQFDCYSWESFYQKQVASLVEKLKGKHLLMESQGANIVSLDQYEMPPCLITKMDGSTIYTSRDLAAVLERKEKYNFNKCLYVTGLEQKLHFGQVFKVIELMGYEWSKDLVHVPYGLVSLGGEKLSTRNGTIIYAEDILNEAIKRSKDMIEEKNPNLENKDLIAKKVGIGAIIYHDLYNQRIKNIDFKWEEVLNFNGATGPYIQYTYARAKSILRKVSEIDYEDIIIKYSFDILSDNLSYSLLKVIEQYPEKILDAARNYEPSFISRYVYTLASIFNKFYGECNIVNEVSSVKEPRLLVVYLTQKILNDAMLLLGIECPEVM